MRIIKRSAVLLILPLLISLSNAQMTPGRYAYLLSCDATLDKLDTVKELRSTTLNLASLSPTTKAAAAYTGGAIDGCVANDLLFAKSRSMFYALLATTARDDAHGRKDYRLLSFTLPKISLAADVPAGKYLSEPSHLQDVGKGSPTVVKESDWHPREQVDLSVFGKGQQGSQLLEWSSDASLLRMATANLASLSLAVAHEKAAKFVPLNNLPNTTALNVHLAPGGHYVLVEEVSGEGDRPVKTGKLYIYDAMTGDLLKTIVKAEVQHSYFMAIAPNGKAIYRKGSNYQFVDLGISCGQEKVSRSITVDTAQGMLFFADE